MASVLIATLMLALCVQLSVQSTPYLQCSNGDPPPTDLRVKGCTQSPCLFVHGTNVEAEWDFTVASSTKRLKPSVKATILGATITYPYPQQNACDTLTNAKCPLDAGENVTYSLSMPVLSIYPKINLSVTFSLLDDSGKSLVCFVLPAKVVDQNARTVNRYA